LIVFLGALLIAAPSLSQPGLWIDPRPGDPEPQWFLLSESESEVRSRLGQPPMIADFGNYRSWQYQLDTGLDHEDFSHALVFRKPDGKLISVSRTYSEERNVDAFFPPAVTSVHHYPEEGKPQFSMRVRRLSGGRVLMAMGTDAPGQRTGQLVLMRESELTYFYPWLGRQLATNR
jgi:hypothetical protein